MKNQLAFLFIFSSFLFSQQPSDSLQRLEREILSSEDTEQELVAKSRRSIISNLKSGSVEKAKEIILFIENRFDNRRVLPFWKGERILLAFWTKEYQKILTAAEKDLPDSLDYSAMVVPQRDLFWDDLKKLSQNNREALIQSIKQSDTKEFERDFLILFFEFLTVQVPKEKNERQAVQNSINQQADEYLRFYGNSPYALFVKKNIRYVIVASPYGYGFSFGMGTMATTGKAAELFENATALSLEFDGEYKNVNAFLSMNLGFSSKVRQQFTYKGTWNKGLDINPYQAEISFGYTLFESKGMRFVPFGGIGVIGFEPPEKTKNIPGNDVSMSSFSGVVGLHCDIPFLTSTSDITNSVEEGYWLFRLRYTYAHSFESDPLRKGGLSMFTISIGGFGRPIVRDF